MALLFPNNRKEEVKGPENEKEPAASTRDAKWLMISCRVCLLLCGRCREPRESRIAITSFRYFVAIYHFNASSFVSNNRVCATYPTKV